MYDKYDVNMPLEEVGWLLESRLLHMIFVYDQMSLQTFDTAMGKKYATRFASISIAYLEDEVLRKAKCKPLVMLSIFWTL